MSAVELTVDGRGGREEVPAIRWMEAEGMGCGLLCSQSTTRRSITAAPVTQLPPAAPRGISMCRSGLHVVLRHLLRRAGGLGPGGAACRPHGDPPVHPSTDPRACPDVVRRSFPRQS